MAEQPPATPPQQPPPGGVPGGPSRPTRDSGPLDQPRIRIVAVLVVAVVVALLVWALVGGDDEESEPASAGVGPAGLSAQELRSTAQDLGQPVYWAGPRSGYTYEYTQTGDGKTYVRYLPPGVAVGAGGADYLIVSTYPYPDALGALEAVSEGNEIELPGGGIALVNEAYPKSVHVAFPGVDYQVEVFDPSPERAREVATSGDVAPVR